MNSIEHKHFNPSLCISNKVRQVNRVIANIYRKYLSPFQITDSQLTILFVLTKKGKLPQKDICRGLHLEKSSLNRNLNRLVARGLISKVDFPFVQMTDAGIELVNAIIPEWEKALKETEELLNQDGVLAVDLLTQKIQRS
ncbi:MarR family winged helix-turn-helix transcriptional regulator [Flagellimonas allohymeniacidonis]|uniref:MarR family transcriptional regulator n=1 Tax=Flagellimonas allohymeniacidonis TaxID=2517819 RepID=A0A4Q8QBR0_9FLAO|nr:MarR family transcriptional regulator [Allomuricauda hymeniacidonis]TAI47812.1 MarR family transcriptional regulator [Allomuricauda hymeniacidonis]